MFKKYSFIFCVMFVVMSTMLCGGCAADDKVALAILEFRDNSGHGAPASAIQDVLVGVLTRIKHFSVVERARLDMIAQEHRLSASGLIDDSTALELGRLSGVKYLVTGSITEYSYQSSGVVIPISGFGIGLGSQVAKVAVDMRVIDTQTGEVALTFREQGAADKAQGAIVTRYGGAFTGEGGGILSTATFNCAKKLAFELQNKLLGDKGAAAVLDSGGKEIMCNIGEQNGSVSVGDIMVAYRNGRAIKDLDGKVLDTEKILLCAFKIKTVDSNHSEGTLLKGCLPRRGAYVTRAPKGWKELSFAKEDDFYESRSSSGSDIDAMMKEMKEEENAKNETKQAEPEIKPAEPEAKPAIQEQKSEPVVTNEPIADTMTNKTPVAEKPAKAASNMTAEEAYQKGKGCSLAENHKDALKYYLIAAEQGHVVSMKNIGRIYENGLGGVPKLKRDALEWYRKAAGKGNADAINCIGVFYAKGQGGLKQDYREALRYYRDAAARGSIWAKGNIGHCYYYGNGVAKNYKEAIVWYTQAANDGNEFAMNSLGVCYHNGQGVARDYRQAMEWYQKSATKGDDWAMLNIGILYEYGHGVTKNKQTAIGWYQQAAEKGNEKAKDALTRLGA